MGVSLVLSVNLISMVPGLCKTQYYGKGHTGWQWWHNFRYDRQSGSGKGYFGQPNFVVDILEKAH